MNLFLKGFREEMAKKGAMITPGRIASVPGIKAFRGRSMFPGGVPGKMTKPKPVGMLSRLRENIQRRMHAASSVGKVT